MNPDLAFILNLTRRLPRTRHASALVHRLLKPYYLLRSRDLVTIDVLGCKMELDPAECVDGWLLFCPQLYDVQEFRYLQTHLKPGDVFLDIGSNIGIYSLLASKAVGHHGRVLAIEADPYNFLKLKRNAELSQADNVTALNIGISDKHETLRLGLNTTGNRGGNSFLSKQAAGIDVRCSPLQDILESEDMKKVKGAKLDVEGFEFRILKRFLDEAPPACHPQFFIVEKNDTLAGKWTGDPVALLQQHGYETEEICGLNHILTRRIEHR